MYQIGDRVLYGVHGVCSVVDVEKRFVDKKQVTYLVLEPVGQDGSRFLIPIHNAAAMGKLCNMLSAEELEIMLQSKEVHSDHWIKDENLRKQTYRDLIASADREKLMGMVHSLYEHKKIQTAAGRKCHLCDENFLRDAEKRLIGEVSIVMNMNPAEAKAYLTEKLA